MNNFFYIIDQPLDKRNYDRYGIEIWEKYSWGVKILDLTPLCYPELWKNFHLTEKKLFNTENYIPIYSWNTFLMELFKTVKCTYYADLAGTSIYSFTIQILLKIFGAKRIVLFPGLTPAPQKKQKSFQEKLIKVRVYGFRYSLKVLSNKLFKKILNEYLTTHISVVTGTKSIIQSKKIVHTLKAHNYDYDIFLDIARQNIKSTYKKFCVFIDQDYCNHSDFLLDKQIYPTTAKAYYPAVNIFLAKIKHWFEFDEILIAAHPRISESTIKNNPYNPNKLIKGRTAYLIHSSNIVIGHDSASLQLAVLFYKPLILVTTNELQNSPWGEFIASTAVALNKPVINLDSPYCKEDLVNTLIVDRSIYEAYIEKFIKTQNSPKIPLWDIVAESIISLETIKGKS